MQLGWEAVRTQAEKILQEAKSVMPLLATYMIRFHVQGWAGV